MHLARRTWLRYGHSCEDTVLRPNYHYRSMKRSIIFIMRAPWSDIFILNLLPQLSRWQLCMLAWCLINILCHLIRGNNLFAVILLSQDNKVCDFEITGLKNNWKHGHCRFVKQPVLFLSLKYSYSTYKIILLNMPPQILLTLTMKAALVSNCRGFSHFLYYIPYITYLQN